VRLPKFPASTGRGTKSPVSRRDIPIQAGTGPSNEEEEAFNWYGIAGGCDTVSKLHEMKVKKMKGKPGEYERAMCKAAGDVDFSKNPMEEFEQMLKKRYGR
jgi:hypothetical protein